MSLSTRFLNLSMKEQICITIILLTLFCILVILIVCGSLMYEILNKDYEQKKLYFYKRYHSPNAKRILENKTISNNI